MIERLNKPLKIGSQEMWIALVCIILLSATYLLFFSPATSPLHFPVGAGIDSFIFQTIGKGWSEGHLPYIEAWDQKGCFIFFVNAVGYWLTGDNTGLYYVQIIFLSTTLFIVYQWMRELFSKAWSAIILIVFLFYFNIYESHGNIVEEFCMPFLFISYYGLYRWAHQQATTGKVKHSLLFACFYGVAIAICALSRLTNALGLCGGIVVIGITILTKKEWKNALLNIAALISSFLLTLLPFVFYFQQHNALYELWYGAIGYNLEYASNPLYSMGWHGYVFGIAHSTVMLLWTLSIIAILLICLNRKKWVYSALAVVSSISLMKWLTNSNDFEIYGQLTTPAFPWIICLVWLIWQESQSKPKVIKGLLRLTIVFLLSLTAFYPTRALIRDIEMLRHSEKVFADHNLVVKHTHQLIKQIPKSDRSSTMAYNGLVAFYINEDIQPCLPYFIHQDAQTTLGGSLKERVYNSFSSGKAKYIVVSKENTLIEPILLSKYTLVKQDTVPVPSDPLLLRLYKRK